MPALTAFIFRNWQAVLGGALIAVLAILLSIRTHQRDHWHGKFEAEQSAYAKFRADSRTAAAEMQARYALNARRIDTEQNRISQESSRDLQTELAGLRARYDSLRASRGANPGGGGGGLPLASIPASGASGASQCDGLSLADAYAADVNTARLIAWQNWWREVAAVQR